MADQGASFDFAELKDVVSIFQILSNTNQNKATDLRLVVRAATNFDDLLALNLCLLWRALETQEQLKTCRELKLYFCGIFEQDPSSKSRETGELLRKTESTTNIDGRSVRWIFSRICLRSLNLLKISLKSLKRSENLSQGPAVDLSVSDQQIIKTVIQFIVVLGICPNLFEGVGVAFNRRTGFTDALCSERGFMCPKCLCECVMVLVNCLDEPSLSLLILSKHLADVLASLIQLGYCGDVCQEEVENERLITSGKENIGFESACKSKLVENGFGGVCQNGAMNKQDLTGTRSTSDNICEGGVLISKADRERCRRALDNIISKMYQPLIIRELLFLQGNMSGQRIPSSAVRSSSTGVHQGVSIKKERAFTRTPKWMKDVCGHSLSKCLTKKNGVENVLRAVLEGASGLYAYMLT